jgi:hypothetical protein
LNHAERAHSSSSIGEKLEESIAYRRALLMLSFITVTILDIIRRPVFRLKLIVAKKKVLLFIVQIYKFVGTSYLTHYASNTSPTG